MYLYKKYKQKLKKGFSLAELSIALTIIGFIASSALSLAITSDFATKKDETESKLSRIEEALAGYVATNHRLPCPSDGTLAVTSTSYGIESNDAATPPICNKNFNNGNIWMGVVPVSTLQLPDDYMFDSWGKRISYLVDYRFTISDINNSSNCDASGGGSDICLRDIASGGITVQDSSHATRTTKAIYALISHGENGHGAFIKNGSATRINAFPVGNPYRSNSPDEIENAELDNAGANTSFATIATVIDKDYLREDDSTDATREYFDDIVRYRTKEQVVRAAGYSIYDSICKTANTVVNNPGANVCTPTADNTQCETFATEINTRCIR